MSETNRDEAADPSIDRISRLPQWQARPEPEELVICPGCAEPNRYIRPYYLFSVIFLVVIAITKWERFTLCPACMRRHILVMLLPTLVAATLLFPLVLIVWGWAFCRTFWWKRHYFD